MFDRGFGSLFMKSVTLFANPSGRFSKSFWLGFGIPEPLSLSGTGLTCRFEKKIR
jgi:hypothetical protein